MASTLHPRFVIAFLATERSTMPASTVSDPFPDHPKHAFPSGSWWMVVVALLLFFGSELFLSTRQESQVFDESAHLFAGFEYWKHGDFGMNPEHPPLIKLVAATPLLSLPLKEPAPVPIPFFKAQTFLGASQFLYGADADSLLLRARLMVAAVFAL